MMPDMIAHIAAQYAEKAKKIGPEGDTSVLTDFIKAVATDRARTAYLAIHHEACVCIATEDHQALEMRLEAAQAMAGCEVAICVADCMGLKKKEDRAPFEHLAAVAYQAEFVRLLRGARAEGSA